MKIYKVNFWFFVVVLLFSFLLHSCKSDTDKIIDEETMTKILVDVHLADGVLNAQSFPIDQQMLPENYYKNILKKYQIDRPTFDSAVSQYSKDRPAYIALYENVIEQLTTKGSLLKQSKKKQGGTLVNGDDYSFTFESSFDDDNLLRPNDKKALSSYVAKSGDLSFYVEGNSFALGHKDVYKNAIDEVDFTLSAWVYYDSIPEKLASWAFTLEIHNNIEVVYYYPFSLLNLKPKQWTLLKVKTTLSLEKPKTNVAIRSYIFNPKNNYFYVDDMKLQIKKKQ
ncbi:MAG: DUF4296 domain-containing protein [Bacteroidales bacterium]|nr:DUF4296 domain-containing protein [Bacteroidales bacterium]